MTKQSSFWDLTPADLREYVGAMGVPAYRADQLLGWAYKRLVDSYAAMTDLPAALRARLALELPMTNLPAVAEQRSADGSTRKLLLRLDDGNSVESVLMEYDPTDAGRGRETVCVSTQAGCAMGCTFCATGQQGFLRNLSSGEITRQVLHFARGLREEGRHVTNIVFMGMGEPLANYSRLVAALRRLIEPSPAGLGLSQRSITVSTVGLVPAMDKLADENLKVTLAVSLHAPDDGLRDTLVPVNTRWKVAEVLAAADAYAARTGRRYSIEYAMIRDINDQPWRADLLGDLLAPRLAHVNLIPLNPTPGSDWDASPKPVEREFVRRLEQRGVPVTVRDTRGREIDGACGQLAASG